MDKTNTEILISERTKTVRRIELTVLSPFLDQNKNGAVLYVRNLLKTP